MLIDGNILKFVGDFKVLKTLAKSGFSNVYLVEHIKTKEKFALKAFKNPNHKFRIQNEINILKSLNNIDGVIKLHKAFYDDKKLFFLYDFANGGTLQQYIKKTKTLDEATILNIFAKLVQLVKNLHSCNIVHHDIKPENILIHNNKYYLCDFGLSSTKENMKILHVKTDTIFTAPEVYNGFSNQSSDIYSLGATLYYLATCKNVFDLRYDDKLSYKMLAHCKLDIDFSKIKSQKIRYLIFRMMEKDYTKRATIIELENILDNGYSCEIKFKESIDYIVQKTRDSFDIYKELDKNSISFAQNNLGVIYSENDPKKAFEYYKKAAKNGLVKAFYNLALCYKNGIGCEKSLKNSFLYFEKAAKKNHESSIFMLALYYECGIYVKKDLKKAYELYILSAFHGNKKAYEKLNKLK